MPYAGVDVLGLSNRGSADYRSLAEGTIRRLHWLNLGCLPFGRSSNSKRDSTRGAYAAV
jgi:hypothetical protein